MFKSSFTVYFEDPFWVGMYQRLEGGALYACKVTFGPQPSDGEVEQFLLQNWHRLAFGPAVAAPPPAPACKNPKRLQRAIARQMNQRGAGTRAQQAVALARQAAKRQNAAHTRAEKQAAAQQRYLLHAAKKKQKHRGR